MLLNGFYKICMHLGFQCGTCNYITLAVCKFDKTDASVQDKLLSKREEN